MATRHAPPPPPPPPVASRHGAALEEVAAGQRYLIFAILVHIGALVARAASDGNWLVFAPIAIAAAALAVVGLLRLAGGLGLSSTTIALLFVVALVPVLAFVMLAMVNARATKALRAGGYEVGFFGARKP